MLSRIAENLYWIGRYIERAENTASLLDVNYHANVEAPVIPGAKGIVTEQWAPLLTLTDDEAAFRKYYDRADGRTVPEWLAFHPQNSSSIRASLTRAREDARGLRDRISLEMWETLNRAYLELCLSTDRVLEQDGLHEYCVAAREASHLFSGIAYATLPRDLGWYFLLAGQQLERAVSKTIAAWPSSNRSRPTRPSASGTTSRSRHAGSPPFSSSTPTSLGACATIWSRCRAR